MSDRSQAQLVAARAVELMRTFAPGDIAVLFRAGFHSYALEIALNKMGVPFRKYGGLRYTEAAHIKDAMSYVRLVLNPLDYTAFVRMAGLSRGVGAKTCLKLYRLLAAGDNEALAGAVRRFPDLGADLAFIDAERGAGRTPSQLLERVTEHYRPRLEAQYPDDYPRRLQGLEQLTQIAFSYADLDMLIADLSLEDPMHEEERSESLVLSTIHSAKGLEWEAVIILDLVEERFPSRHSLVRPDDFEEERRLMYVACTRAKESLDLYVPASVYDKSGGGSIPAVPSPFVRELSPSLYTEWQEGYSGALVRREVGREAGRGLGREQGHGDRSRSLTGWASEPPGTGGAFSVAPFTPQGSAGPGNSLAGDSATEDSATGDSPTGEPRITVDPGALGQGRAPARPPSECGFCRHRIFGRGKIVQHLPPDKVRVNFPGVGLKVIMAAYVTMEE